MNKQATTDAIIHINIYTTLDTAVAYTDC